MRVVSIFAFLIFLNVGASGQIAAWDFNGESSLATSTADTYDANMDASNLITRGSGASASTASNSFRTQGFKNDGISTSNTDYFQITLSASPGYRLSLSTIEARFNGTATFYASPGVTSQFAYSLDETTFILIGSPVTSTSLTMAQFDLSSISDLQDVNASTIITIRYYASGQTTTGGWGFYSGSPGSYGLSVGGTLTTSGTISTKLSVTSVNNNSSPSANEAFGVVVQSQDDSGIPGPVSSNTNISLSLASGSGTLAGTLSGTIPAGSNSVTISGVTYDAAESGVSVTASRTSGDALSAGTSSTFTVLDAASQLAFVNFPTGGQQDVDLSSFTVEARRADNSVDQNFMGDITLGVASGPGGVSGTVTHAAVSGVATFDDIQLDAGGTYTLSGYSSGLTGATSSSINILSTTLPLLENFEYALGTTLVSNGWVAQSASGTNPITVSSGALTYSGYSGSAVGNKVALTTSGEDVNRSFAPISSGSAYASFLVNVSSATTTGDYFFSLSVTGTSYFARVFLKADASGNLAFGIAKTTGSPTYTGFNYSLNMTYLLAVAYTFNSESATDDQVHLWVNPSTNMPPVPPSDASQTDGGSDAGSIGAIVLRQGGSSVAAELTLSGIRVGASWSDAPLPLTASAMTARTETGRVHVDFSTATEIDVVGFTISRACAKAGPFQLMSSYSSNAALKAVGSTTTGASYEFVDAKVSGGQTYYYRIDAVGKSGVSTQVGNVMEVRVTAPKEFAVYQNYPNPFNPATRIRYDLKERSSVTIEVYNLLGMKVRSGSFERNAGTFQTQLDFAGMASGVYYCRVTITGQSGTSFVGMKKMLLMK